CLDRRLREQIMAVRPDGGLTDVRRLYEWGKGWGYQPERELLRKTITESLQQLLRGLGPDTDLPDVTSRAGQLLDAAELLGIPLDPWQPQNDLLDAYARFA